MISHEVFAFLKAFRDAGALSEETAIVPPAGLNESWLSGLLEDGVLAEYRHMFPPAIPGDMPSFERRYFLTAWGVDRMEDYLIAKKEARAVKRDRIWTRGIAIVALLIALASLLSELRLIPLPKLGQ
ncbi:MAG: hypothetical protein GX540_04385 [Clostridiales bacterium]|nr:hypothetical protein [Clostridiales bacterium]